MTRKSPPTDPPARWQSSVVPPKADRDGENPSRSESPLGENGVKSDGRWSGAPPVSAQSDDPAQPVGDRTPELAIAPDQPPPIEENGFLAKFGSRQNSSFLSSLIIHLAILIILALMTYRLKGTQKGVSIEAGLSSPSANDSTRVVEIAEAPGVESPQMNEAPTTVSVDLVDARSTAATKLLVAPKQNGSLAQPTESKISLGGGKPTNSLAYFGGGGMTARTPEGRKRNGDLYGATRESEQAVENALRWLAEHQRQDGSWSFDLQLDPCNGRCRHGRQRGEPTPTPSTAATGLALLAFLGAGYSSDAGPYQDVVSKGIYYLRSVATESEYGNHWQHGGRMYGHGIALMAISEALVLSERDGAFDTDLYHYAERGSFFTVAAQHPNGSWGYTPGSPGDTTLTGWQVLSLIGAKKAGIQMRSDTFSRAREFLMSVREGPDYAFGYQRPEAEKTTTAIALALLMYLGQTPGYTFFDEAIDKLAEDGPTLTNVYHDYYATMALHHFRHREWDSWNTRLRDHLVRTQATEGHEAGSWHFKDKWGDVGGRLYTTAMCTLTLEVYYRFLPLYAPPPEFPL